MNKLGSITDDATIAFIKAQLDEHAYNMYLGRNLNFRYDDATSIYNSLKLDIYLKRSLKPYGPAIKKEIIINNSLPLFILHESFSHIKTLYKAYHEMKFIHLIRHPVDVVHSWFMNDWGRRYQSDPFSFIPVLQSNNDLVPWHADDWKDEYGTLSNIDRIIKNISFLSNLDRKTFLSLEKKHKKILLEIKYERIVEQTHEVIDCLSIFLSKKQHDQINYILTKEKCPNKISLKQRANKLKEIKKIASEKYINLLNEMINQYENN